MTNELDLKAEMKRGVDLVEDLARTRLKGQASTSPAWTRRTRGQA